MNGLEGLGEVVTGGMAARAIEPHAGEAHGHAHTCLNCGTRLTGEFCHRCGQQAHVHRTLGAFWHDLLHGVLHFEGKIWRTLPMLAWRPGELTRRYVAGERARFVSPMALFLFSVFLMFAVLSIGGASLLDTGSKAAADEIAAEMKEADGAIAKLETERAAARQAGASTAKLDEDIAKAKLARDLVVTGEQEGRRQKDEPLGVGEWKSGWGRLDQGIAKANANPSLLFYKLQNNAYKFSWALIPISVPFVWLLFLHRRRYRRYRAYDHVIFVTYSIAFMSILFIAIVIGDLAGVWTDGLGLALLLIPPLHIYRQLKGAYQLSRWSAVWRTVVLLQFIAVTTTIFLGLLLVLGVLG